MQTYCESNDRSGKEYFLFALACAGVFIGIYGVVLSTPALGMTGLVLLIIAAWSLQKQPEP